MENKIAVEINAEPMSVNKAWRGRRFRSDDYEEYEELVHLILPKKKMIAGWVEVEFHFYIKNFAMADVDNLIKPLLDILVKKEYIEDDRKVVKISATKFKSDKEKIRIWIKPV